MQTAIAYLIAARRCEIDELNQLNRTCDLVRAVSELVQHLQRERGASNMQHGSEVNILGACLEELRKATDQVRQQFLLKLEQTRQISGVAGGSQFFTRIAVALHALEDLSAIRQGVSSSASTPAQSTERYSYLIKTMLALVFEAADIAIDPDVSRLLVALFNLMQGKEYVGQERAAGVRAFDCGRISQGEQRSLGDLIELQDQCFERFESFCGATILAQWKALQSTMPLADIERLRRKLVMPSFRAEAALTQVWFEVCSKRIDGMYLVESHLTLTLQQACKAKVARTELELTNHQALSTALESDDLSTSSELVISDRIRDQDRLGADALKSNLARDLFNTLQKQTRHLEEMTQELTSARTALDERKLIERAKGLLMSHLSLNEESAYRYLRDKAMSQNRRLVDVAESVLSVSDFLPSKPTR